MVMLLHGKKKKSTMLSITTPHEASLSSFTAVSECSSGGKGCRDTDTNWKILNSFALEKVVAPGRISLCKFRYRHDM